MTEAGLGRLFPGRCSWDRHRFIVTRRQVDDLKGRSVQGFCSDRGRWVRPELHTRAWVGQFVYRCVAHGLRTLMVWKSQRCAFSVTLPPGYSRTLSEPLLTEQPYSVS